MTGRQLHGARAKGLGKIVNRTCQGCGTNGFAKGQQCGAKLPGLVSSVMLGNPSHNYLMADLPAGTAKYDLIMGFTTCKKLLAKHWVKSSRQRPQGLPQGV